MKRSVLKKISKLPYAALLKKAARIFNAWIRARDVKKLRGRCYTCSNKGSEAGHFRHNNNATKFSEVFVNMQCSTCNRWKSGNLGVYALRLIKEHGLEKVQALEKASRKPKRFTKEELEQIIERYGKNSGSPDQGRAGSPDEGRI